MGMRLSKSKIQGKSQEIYPPQVLFLGPYQAGKSTLRHQLAFGNLDSYEEQSWMRPEHEKTIVEGEEIGLWDITSRDSSRPMLQLYFGMKNIFVFVLDSSDVDGIDDALSLFDDLFFTDKRTKKKLIMIVANKQDVEGALPVEKIEEKLEKMLSPYGPSVGKRHIFVKGCSAKTGEGVQEAFTDLVELSRLQKEGKLRPGFLQSHGLLRDDKNDNYTSKDKDNDGKNEKETQLKYLLKLYNNAPSVKSILCY